MIALGPALAVLVGAVVACGVIAGFAVGLATGSAQLALAVIAAVIVAVFWIPFALRRADWAVGVLLVVYLTNISDVVRISAITPYIVSLAIAVAAVALAVAKREIRLRWSVVYTFALIYWAILAVSILVAPFPRETIGIVTETLRDFVFFAVVVVFASGSRRNVYLIAASGVATVAALCALSLFQQFVLDNSTDFWGLSNVPFSQEEGTVVPRHSGPQSDPNFWARSVLLWMPIAQALWAMDAGRARRWLWVLCWFALAGGLFLTSSRGGFLGAGIAILMFFAVAGRQYRWMLLFAPIIAIVLFAIPGVGSRLLTLQDIDVGSAASAASDESLEGRVAAQEAAFAVFLDHPVIGVGAGNFPLVELEYQRRLGITDVPLLAPHNIYLQAAADTGSVGLLSWLLFLGSSMFVCVRAIVRARRLRDGVAWQLNLMAAGVLSGVAGWAVASIFLHAAEMRYFYTIVALGVAADLILRNRDEEQHVHEAEIQAKAPALV